MTSNIEIATEYWRLIDTAKFEDLIALFADNAAIILPNTNERFKSIESFVKFNRDYPGRWYAEIIEIESIGEKAISITKVRDEAESMSFFVTSVFEMNNGKIYKMKEYWSENSERPEWRKDNRYTEEIR